MFKLELLARTIRSTLYMTYSKFDFTLFQCYVIQSPVDLSFHAQELPVRQTPLQVLHHIPTFPDSQWASAYWLSEPVRLHA